MSKFYVGQKVVCIDSGGNKSIKDNSIYTVKELSEFHGDILLEEIEEIFYHFCRFEDFDEWTAKQPKKETTKKETPHIHAELIKAWADGKKIQLFDQDDNDGWEDVENPSWIQNWIYRIKPEIQYPETTLSGNFLNTSWMSTDNPRNESSQQAFTRIANEVLKEFIISGEMYKFIESQK